MNRLSHFTSTFLTLAAVAIATDTAVAEESINLWTGEGATIGRILVPQLTLTTAFGGSTAPDGSLVVGHHDPDRDGITMQNAEIALTAQLASNLTATGFYAAKIDLDDHWGDEFEEYYLAYTAFDGAMRIKGGRFYTQFGFQNIMHPHDFTFVDQNIVNGRYLGEDEATTVGGEISVPLISRLPNGWSDRITISFGTVPDSHGSHFHSHNSEAAFDGELAAFNDLLGTAEYRVTYLASDTVQYRFGIAAACGKNHFERGTQVYGLHFERLWQAAPEACEHKDVHTGHVHRDHAHDHGGTREFLRWRTEVMLRRFGAVSQGHSDHEEHADHEGEEHHEEHAGEEHHDSEEEAHENEPSKSARKSFTDAGFYSELTYGRPGGKWQGHLRGEFASGIAEAGVDQRWRISPAISWLPSERLPVSFKLQYNYDHTRSLGEEHSVWLQVKVQWGDRCSHAY